MVDPERSFRAAFTIIFVATFAISAFFRWSARRNGGMISRRAERGSLVLGRVLIGVPLLASLLLYILKPSWIAWSQVMLPQEARWVAAFLGFAMIPMVYWVFRSLGRNVSETVLTRPGQVLVTSGPYRWVRHPLYSASLMIFGLLSVVAASWLLLLFVSIAAAGIQFIVGEEEAQLRNKYPQYAEYMTRTGRFVPRWKRSG